MAVGSPWWMNSKILGYPSMGSSRTCLFTLSLLFFSLVSFLLTKCTLFLAPHSGWIPAVGLGLEACCSALGTPISLSPVSPLGSMRCGGMMCGGISVREKILLPPSQRPGCQERVSINGAKSVELWKKLFLYVSSAFCCQSVWTSLLSWSWSLDVTCRKKNQTSGFNPFC